MGSLILGSPASGRVSQPLKPTVSSFAAVDSAVGAAVGRQSMETALASLYFGFLLRNRSRTIMMTETFVVIHTQSPSAPHQKNPVSFMQRTQSLHLGQHNILINLLVYLHAAQEGMDSK